MNWTYCVCSNGTNTFILHRCTVTTANSFYNFASSEYHRSTLPQANEQPKISRSNRNGHSHVKHQRAAVLAACWCNAGRLAGKDGMLIVRSLLYWQVYLWHHHRDGYMRSPAAKDTPLLSKLRSTEAQLREVASGAAAPDQGAAK